LPNLSPVSAIVQPNISLSTTKVPCASFSLQQLPSQSDPTTVLHKTTNKKNCKKKYTLNEEYHSAILVSQLIQLENYWTQPNNLLRRESLVNSVTHKKRKERILCFMGWCLANNEVQQPDLWMFDITKSSEHKERYEKYLNYLKNTRKLGEGTMVEHFTAAIYALKMLYARYYILFVKKYI
jgi:hypothetical protein